MIEMNYFAVVAAAVSAFLLGGIWYAKPVFGKAWMAASGVTKERAAEANQAKVFGVAFVWSLLGAYVFAMFLGPAPAFAFATGAGFAAGFQLPGEESEVDPRTVATEGPWADAGLRGGVRGIGSRHEVRTAHPR